MTNQDRWIWRSNHSPL